MPAALGIGPEDPNEEGFHGFRFAQCLSRDIESDPAGGQVLGAEAIGEEPVVPDALKAIGEHVEEKPTDKFLDRETHHLHFVAMSVVAPTEADLAVLASELRSLVMAIRWM